MLGKGSKKGKAKWGSGSAHRAALRKLSRGKNGCLTTGGLLKKSFKLVQTGKSWACAKRKRKPKKSDPKAPPSARTIATAHRANKEYDWATAIAEDSARDKKIIQKMTGATGERGIFKIAGRRRGRRSR